MVTVQVENNMAKVIKTGDKCFYYNYNNEKQFVTAIEEEEGNIFLVEEEDGSKSKIHRHSLYPAEWIVINSPEQKSDPEMFTAILEQMEDTFNRKNKDYGNSFSDLYKEIGMPYAYGHIKEKINRIGSIMKNGKSEVLNESIDDSLLDCANYCVLTLIERKKNVEAGKEKKQ